MEIKKWHLVVAFIIGIVVSGFFQVADCDRALSECLESDAFYKEQTSKCLALTHEWEELHGECMDIIDYYEGLIEAG